MMTTWYQINYRGEVEPVEVVKETNNYITIVVLDSWSGKRYERRERKTTRYSKYYRTQDEAIQSIIDGAEGRLVHARNDLKRAEVERAAVREKYGR